MSVPIYSTVTLFAEILVSISICYIFYSSYKKNHFPKSLVLITLGYEILFNINYMIERVATHAPATPETKFDILLAIFHGTLSLIMFIALIVFMILAWANYNKKVNYFKKHKNLTITFLFFWFLSVLSGVLFYFVEYFGLFDVK